MEEGEEVVEEGGGGCGGGGRSLWRRGRRLNPRISRLCTNM